MDDEDPPTGSHPLFNKFSNPYSAAMQAKNRKDQLAAFAQFSAEEAEKHFQICEELLAENDFDNLDSEAKDKWSYEKGYLDACRMFSGLHMQAYMGYTMMVENGVLDPDSDDSPESE